MNLQKPPYDLYTMGDNLSESYETFTEMRQNDPVLMQPGLDQVTPAWYVSSHEAVYQVLLDHQSFLLQSPMGEQPKDESALQPDPFLSMMNYHLLHLDGKDHQRIRGLFTKAFSPDLIHQMGPRMETIAHRLIDQMRQKIEADLIESFAIPFTLTVIAEFIGIPAEDFNRFRSWTSDIFRLNETAEAFERYYDSLKAFHQYLDKLCALRRIDPKDDLLSALVRVEEAGQLLNEQELLSNVMLLIIAGHETSVHLIGNAIKLLLDQPEHVFQIKEGDADLETMVEEILRYHSPVDRAIIRYAGRDTELCGMDIKKGDQVIAMIGSANRDADKFTGGETLIFDRSPNKHLAFGHGAHFCLGAPLARLEGKIAIEALLMRLPGLELTIPKAELRWRSVPMFRGLEMLPVRWNS
jgi:cytochrome P450